MKRTLTRLGTSTRVPSNARAKAPGEAGEEFEPYFLGPNVLTDPEFENFRDNSGGWYWWDREGGVSTYTLPYLDLDCPSFLLWPDGTCAEKLLVGWVQSTGPYVLPPPPPPPPTPPPADTPPATPTGLGAIAGNTEIFLNWNDNGEGDLASYRVYRSLTGLVGSFTLLISVTTSSYVDTGLTNGTTYWYTVSAVDDAGFQSPQSASVNATPVFVADTTAPAVPTGLSATAGDTLVDLDWNDNTETDLVSYGVYQATASGGPYSLVTFVADSLYTVTGLTNGTQYWFKVTAKDASGNESAQSASDDATPVAGGGGDPPAIPTNLQATAGNTQIVLTWNPVTAADFSHYNVYRSTTGATGTYSFLITRTVANYTNTGLINGSTYWYKVTSEDTGTNESGFSNVASATPTTTSSGDIPALPSPDVVFNSGNPYTAAKVTAEPAGTVFQFTTTGGNSGGPNYLGATIPNKDNNKYRFDSGTKLDGQNNTNLAFAFDNTVTGVQIWDCEWTNYLGQNSSGVNNTKGAAAIRLRTDWRLWRGYGHHNKYSAYAFDGDNIIVDSTISNYNGQYGFRGGSCDNCICRNTETAYNGGVAAIDVGGDTGGCKIVHSTNFQFINVHAHHNIATGTQGGNGLWTDINNVDPIYDSCNVHDNEGAGIFHEVSLGFEIKNCTLRNNGQDNSDGGIHPVKANIQISNSGGDGGWVHDNDITITSGTLGYYAISCFNSNHAQWTLGNISNGCLGVRNLLIEDNTVNLSGSQWKAIFSLTGNLPSERSADQFCGQSAITAAASNNDFDSNSVSYSGGQHNSTPYIYAGVRVSAASWASHGFS